jgi:hypothetical protein
MSGLVFDGIDLHSLNFYVTSDSRSAEYDEKILEIDGMNGAISLSERLVSRNITIEGFVFGENTKLAGLVSANSGSYELYGSGTKFTNLRIGNDLKINNKIYKVAKIVSDTLLEIENVFNETFTNVEAILMDYSVCMNNSSKLSELVSTATAKTPKELFFPDTSKSIFVKRGTTPFISSVFSGATFKASAQKITLNFIAHDPYFYGEEWALDGAILNTKLIESDVSYPLITPFMSEDISAIAITSANTNGEWNLIDSNGFIIIDTPYVPKTDFTINSYDGFGGEGFEWLLYIDGVGTGFAWEYTNPSTTLVEITTDLVENPATSLSVVTHGALEGYFIWETENMNTNLEVQNV